MSDVDPDAYRHAVGRFATGVTVVSTRVGTMDHAMTANAVCSVSLEPVLMMVSIEKDARLHDALVEAGVFGVSILSTDQRSIAAWLATRGRPLHGQLGQVPHRRGEHTGVALINDALATFELQISDIHSAGDHSLVVGNVLSLQTHPDPGAALVYYRGRYGVQE
ncbi:flavin reductase family protein [Dermacoccaceae bacterium W4C1]